MKKYLIIGAVVLFVGICIAQIQPIAPYDMDASRVDPGQIHTARNRWVVIDTTSAADTEPSDLTDIERTYQTVKAVIATGAGGDEEISIFDVPRSWNAVRFRCRGVTEGVNVIHYLYFGTLGDGNRHTDSTTADCELTYAGKLDWTLGDQVSADATYDEMADTLTVTAGHWNKSWGSQSPASDFVAEATIDLIGADLIVVICQTTTCDCQLLATGF